MAFTIKLTGVKSKPDTWDFTVTGITAPKAHISFGDSSSPLELTPDAQGTATASHAYIDAGHHTYTARAWQDITPVAATLQELSTKADTLEGIPALAARLKDIPATIDEAFLTGVVVDVGKLTIDAHLEADPWGGPLPVVQLDLWFDDPANVYKYEVWRFSYAETALPLLVRIGASTTGAQTFADVTAPIGVRVWYVLRAWWVGAGDATDGSDSVLIEGTRGCFLTNPVTGKTLSVEVQSWPNREFEARRSIIGVVGRPDPVVISDTHLWASGEWTLLTRTDTDRRDLENLLTGSPLVLLRTQPSSSIESVYASVGNVTERRWVNKGGDQHRLIDVEVQEIAPIPAAARLLQSTLGELEGMAATLQELSELRPTLAQLAAMPIPRGTS